MTCIAGVVVDGHVVMGGDRSLAALITYPLTTTTFPKIMLKQVDGFDPLARKRTRKMIIGSSGDLRMHQVIQYEFELPVHERDKSTTDYMAGVFVPALRNCLIETGVLLNDRGMMRTESAEVMIGYAGRIFRTGHYMPTMERIEGYEAIGTGREIGLGVFHALRNEPSARLQVEAVLEASAHHLPSVSGPFDFLEIKPGE